MYANLRSKLTRDDEAEQIHKENGLVHLCTSAKTVVVYVYTKKVQYISSGAIKQEGKEIFNNYVHIYIFS